MIKQTTALLYFSRQVETEARKKAWFKNRSTHKNQLLAKTLIQQSRKAVEGSGLPVFHFHEGNQEGENFGERLANAYQELYTKGFSAVVAVGNDSPEISKLDWSSIQADLDLGRNVLGKSIRGGAYLLGITASSFDKAAFENLPWQSNQLYANLYSQLQTDSIYIVELEVFRDINTFFDLKKFRANHNISAVFKKLIVNLLQVEAEFKFQLSHFYFLVSKNTPLRAPPLH